MTLRGKFRFAVVLGTIGAVLCVGSGQFALAETGVTTDPLQASAFPPVGAVGVDPTTYAALFAGVPPDAPTGTIVADSGFRAFPNGFSFINYGADLANNQKYFGQPTPLPTGGKAAVALGLDTASMRRVFGDGVCVGGGSGSCILTESAKVVQKTANTWAAAGHCFGFATLANALYTGKLSPAEVAGGAVNTLTTTNATAQRAIMRAFIAQYFSAVGIRPPTMADAVSRLRAGITRGKIPFTILMYGAAGGHALVPYAVLDKGAGKFDIAVYDPNLPNQPRAMHIDTIANSWSFTGSPELSNSVWSSADSPKPAYFVLGDVDSALKKQECIFCQNGKSGTLVSFSSVRATNGGVFDAVTLTDSQGNPLEPGSYRMIPPTDVSGGSEVAGPVFLVNRGVNFDIGLNGESMESAQSITVTVLGRKGTRSLRLSTMNSASRGTVRVRELSGGLGFEGASENRGTAIHTVEKRGVSYRFQGIETTDYHKEAMRFASYGSRGRVIFRENDLFPSVWSIRMSSDSSQGSANFKAVGVVVGVGSQLVITYADWSGGIGRPQLWLDKGSNGSLDVRIPLHKAGN